MCRACDAADMRLDAALALKFACEGPRLLALRQIYQPIDDDDVIAVMGRRLDRMMELEGKE